MPLTGQSSQPKDPTGVSCIGRQIPYQVSHEGSLRYWLIIFQDWWKNQPNTLKVYQMLYRRKSQSPTLQTNVRKQRKQITNKQTNKNLEDGEV